MRSLLLKTLVISTSTLSFIACSGGGGGGSAASGDGFGSTTSAQFIDAPVKGLTFKNASGTTGKTGAEGKFSCARGEVVSFELKGLKLGSAPCGDKIFVHDLFAPVGVSGFGWSKVASVIQSFSTGTSELDLTAANDSSLDLSGLSFNGGFDAALGPIVTSAAIAGTSHKDVATAGSAADLSLEEHAALDSVYSTALSSFVTAGGEITFHATLTSGTKVAGEEYCHSNAVAVMKVTEDTVGAKKIFSLETLNAASYDVEDHIDKTTWTCKSGVSNTTCIDLPSSMYPNKKVITGTNFDVASAATHTGYAGVTGLNVDTKTSVSMKANVTTAGVTVSGTFYNEETALAVPSNSTWTVGQKIKCTYKIVQDEK